MRLLCFVKLQYKLAFVTCLFHPVHITCSPTSPIIVDMSSSTFNQERNTMQVEQYIFESWLMQK
ncbi:hypothetical protein M758_6G183900 [Ceratodon purpureus]|nr:hypothetical protein M758_6G183900 [Ceratodon purpureus]